MQVIVTGGRRFSNYHVLSQVLSAFPVTLLIQGGATGADALARQWAWENRVECKTYDADWVGLGKAAGPVRNEIMCRYHRNGVGISFPGGTGTENMKNNFIKYGIYFYNILVDKNKW